LRDFCGFEQGRPASPQFQSSSASPLQDDMTVSSSIAKKVVSIVRQC
jgi:hypothetical protein